MPEIIYFKNAPALASPLPGDWIVSPLSICQKITSAQTN